MILKSLNLLLADDDTDDCLFFEQALETFSLPTHLSVVHDGEELMKLLTSETGKLPHVLFLDINMPRKNGFECLSEIRKSESLKQLPVIMFSTSFEQDIVNQLYTKGANYFVQKPADYGQFVKIIQQSLTIIDQLESAQPTRENFVLTVDGDFTKKNSIENRESNIDEFLAIRTELTFQHEANEKLVAELTIARNELVFLKQEKGKRATELGIANKELVFEDEEKSKRAAELIIANKELVFQNEEKEKRAAELIIANKELLFQNKEKEKRAAELIVANKELLFQNEEKEKRAAELIIANNELIFQNEEKEKRAAELIIANNELLAFTYVSSHDLQEPLRKIQTFATIILQRENQNLSENGKYNFQRIRAIADRMQQLIEDLLAFSRVTSSEHTFEKTDLISIVQEVQAELKDSIYDKGVTVDVGVLCAANIVAFQFRQLLYNLLSNAIKFSSPTTPPLIQIRSKIIKGFESSNEKISPEKEYCHIIVKDNGIGFEPQFNERIFGVFQKLHNKDVYGGTGIGLAIVRKIVENHNGIITATGELHKGATFDIFIPNN